MHIVVFSEDDSNPDFISRMLSKSDIESCDLFVSDWTNQQKITACLGAIRNNFYGDVYLITESVPVPKWAFDLESTVSIVWKNQSPVDVALSLGPVEIDLWENHEIHTLERLPNVKHFLTSTPRELLKPCKIKKNRTVYALKDEQFFKLP